MPRTHRLLAVTVAVLWGINFLAIRATLEHFPPFLAVALRWSVLAVPTLLLVPRPRVRTRWLVGYGLGFGVLQFTFLYWGMAAGMPTGLASVVLQASAPFTVVLGAVLLREPSTARRVVGVALAVAGLAIVGSARLGTGAGLVPFLLTVAGGFGWALGNLASRQAQAPNPFHLTMWMTVVPPLPMFALSLLVEGPARIGEALSTSLTAAAVPALLGLLYTCLPATVLGSGLWTWLLTQHPAGSVAPFSMLVPVTGLTAAWLVLGEALAPAEVLGSAVVVVGVLVASLGGRRRRRLPTLAEEAVPEPTPGDAAPRAPSGR